MNTNVTRRSLVAGGMATAAVASIGLGTALADEGAVETSRAVSPWGQEYPFAAEPPAIDAAQVEEEVDVDVAVFGLGVAGVAAFRSACEQGVKVAAFEKGAEPSVRSSQYAYVNGTMTEQLGLGTVDEDEIIREEWNESAQMASYAIIRNFVRNESEAFDWWVNGDPDILIPSYAGEEMPSGEFGDPDAPSTVKAMADLSIDPHAEPQASYPTRVSLGNHAHVVNANLQKGLDLGNEAYFGHFLEQLVVEDGRVTGAYVRNAETGMYKKVNCAKGAVLAMGGCGSNKELVKCFYPAMAENGNLWTWTNFDVEDNPTNSGDVYAIGFWAGAGFSQMMAPMCHVMGGPNDVANMATSSAFTGPMLRLNYDGKRFMNEDSNVSDCELAFDRQPRRKAFLICDSHLDEQVEGGMVSEFTTTLEALDERVDNETVWKADTLEELFAAIPDFDAETALASTQRYNELCAAGYDEDFGKQEKYLYPVADGPFYAQRMGIGLCLTTMGGLKSDEFAHALDWDLHAVPGLYVCGNSQGDRFAVKYPFKLSGASHAMAMYYGKVAGENCATGI